MRGERIVGRRSNGLDQLLRARQRIRGQRLKVVAQLRPAPKEVDSIFDALAWIRERAGKLWEIEEACLKDDVAQIHRAIVAVDTADRAVIVGVRVDRDHDRTQAVGSRIDGAHEERPAAGRRARYAAVEKTQSAGRRTCRRGVEPRVDTRVAQHEHVAPPVGGKGSKLLDCGFEAPGGRRGIEDAAIEPGPKRSRVDESKNSEGDRNEKSGRLLLRPLEARKHRNVPCSKMV
jgi:hypothetical protein